MGGKRVLLIYLILFMTAFTLAMTPLAKSFPTVSLNGYTDKLQYFPGEAGTVYFWIYNWGPELIILKNITIYYPWYSPIWGGNRTIANIDIVISKDGNYSNTDSFTIFNDSRAVGGNIEFHTVYDYGEQMDVIPLDVVVPESPSLIAVYGSTPTIDGTIDVHEWSDAASSSFNNTKVFVKQDGTNLYVGFNNSDDQFHDDDTVLIQFDVEYDGGLTLQPDDIAMLVYRNGTLLEANVTGGTWTLKEVSGWTAVVNSTLDMWQVEFNITYPKISVVAGVGKTIGAMFARYRGLDGTSPEVFSWPPGYTEVYANPSMWGAITSAGYNWIPEFPSLPILLLLMIATLLTVIVHRKRDLKNRKTNSDDAT